MLKKLLIVIIYITSLTTIFSVDLHLTVIDRDLEMALEGVRIREADSGFETYTDFNGEAIVVLDDNRKRAVIIAELIGYEHRKQLITDFDNPLIVELLMEGVLEGQELVVEVEAIGETDAEVGVSTVIEKEIIQAAAKMGIIEDVMNAVKILPGVTYSGGFGSGISVRGSDPSGVTSVLDGFVTKYPNHWGGTFSIFNPNIVESIKFSPGIFSVKNGQATSALLEVNTVDPSDGLKFSGILSTSTIEAFSQIPFGKDDEFGLLTGFRLTNFDLAVKTVALAGEALAIDELTKTIDYISRAPYIYDFYLKGLYEPSETFKWYLNGFWGNDGLGIANAEMGDKTKEISNNFNFFYENSDMFFTTGAKILPLDNLLLDFVIGYENWVYDVEIEMSEEGYRDYSEAFKEKYPAFSLEDGYEVYTASNYNQGVVKQGVQGRLDIDWSLNDNYILQSGLGTSLDFENSTGSGTMWAVMSGDAGLEYKPIEFEPSDSDTKLLLSFAYVNLNANLISDLIKMDLGVRTDHAYFMGEDDMTINTYPEFAPRINIVVSPNEKNDFSIGTGLFNKNPFGDDGFDHRFSYEDFELKSEKTFSSVVGWQSQLSLDLRFKIEGYYKYIYDRLYYSDFEKYYDGTGYAVGGDFLLEKKNTQYLDGLMSYTYVYARYEDPQSDLGEYYPSYHRFNTLNFLLNYKPRTNFTFTTKLTFATGTPKSEDDEPQMFVASVVDSEGNLQFAEMYSRESYYSDILRSNYSLPLDLKFSWHSYLKESKYEWEIYFALQDALAPVLSAIQPSESVRTSKWAGDSEEAPSGGFSFPIPSIGFSMSF